MYISLTESLLVFLGQQNTRRWAVGFGNGPELFANLRVGTRSAVGSCPKAKTRSPPYRSYRVDPLMAFVRIVTTCLHLYA